MTDEELEVRLPGVGRRIRIKQNVSLGLIVSGLIMVGMVWQQTKDIRELAAGAASKQDLAELAAKADTAAARAQNARDWIVRHDAEAKANWGVVKESLEELKARVRDVEIRSYRSGYDEGAADEAIFGPVERIIPSPTARKQSLPDWNPLEQVSRKKQVPN